MTNSQEERRAWRDFAHTLRIITAAALAEHDWNQRPRPEHQYERRFELTLLAAASDDETSLPKMEVLAAGGGLAVAFEERDDGIGVHLQLKGYLPLVENAEKQARLVSGNGAIDYAFRFNREGEAVTILADTPEVRAGLSSLSVFVEQDVETE